MPSLPPNFVYSSHPARVIFGSGTSAQLTEEVDRLGLKHVMVLATAHQRADAEALAARLGSRTAAVFAGAAMHTPVTVTQTALAVAQQNGADGFVALGGGSTTGLGKAIALRTDLPQIVLPTTYAGSEMTPILGETADGAKTTLTPEGPARGGDLRRRPDSDASRRRSPARAASMPSPTRSRRSTLGTATLSPT